MQSLRKTKNDFYEVSISVIKRMQGNWPFDISIKRTDTAYTKLFLKGDLIDLERVEDYNKSKGVNALFVHSSDYRKYTLYVEEVAQTLLINPQNKNIDSNDVAQVLKDMADLTLIEIFSQLNFDDESYNHASIVTHSCIELLKKNPMMLIRILKGLSQHPYHLKHSMVCSVFAILLGKLDGISVDRTLQNIAMGGMLHDLGMSMLSFDPEAKNELSSEEYRELKTHPSHSKRMLETVKDIPWEVRMMAFQHHEQPNGFGYPNGMHDKEIYYPAKIISIADGFSALTSVRPYRESVYTPIEALQLMVEDRGRYDFQLLAKFRSLFAKISKAA